METRQIALVVNINAYPVLSSLQTSAFNRERLGQYLTEYANFQVRFLPSPKKLEDQTPPAQIPVSQKELENAILNLFHPQRDPIPQTALLYFTGHGLRKKKGIVEEFLATSDSNPSQGNWGINLQWLQKVFANSPIPNKMIWLDCFYGEELAFDFDECLPQAGGGSSFLATRRGVRLIEAGIDVNNDYFAQALLENALYDDNAQLLSSSFMEYALPRADSLPSFEIDHTVTPSPHNPLGVKGIGEAGCIASTAAVANAVNDALEPFGIRHLDMPLSPPRIWKAIQAAAPAQAAD